MTPREPDRYEAKGVETWRALRIMTEADAAPIIAAALRQAADEALEKAAVAFAEAPTTQHSGAAVASVLRYLARDSAPQPAAAPAHEPERFFPGAAEVMGEPDAAPAAETPQKWGGPYLWPESAPPSEPVAPSLLPRVLAVLDAEYRRRGGDDGGGYVGALAAELRRYIATDPRDKRIAELEAALSDWRAVEAECGAVDCHCGCHVHATDLADGGEPPK